MASVSGQPPRLLNRLLLRPALAMRVRIQRAIEDAGYDDFRIAHMNVFAWLPEPGARIGELARQAQLSKQTMTELVSYLERHGYVYRTRDPSDGRAWIIRFTERGAALHQVAVRALRDADARAWDERYPELPADVVRQLFERRFATAEACDLTTHVVRADGAVVAWCNLYRTGDEAQVESVNTLPEWRRRGFARAVVLDAVAAAHEAGCEFIFLIADRDDWPREFYERLGFGVIAEQRSFARLLD